MNSHSSDDKNSAEELRELLQKLHASNLTKAEFTKLKGLLSSDQSFRWRFIHDVHLRVGLRSWAQSHGVASEQSLVNLLNATESDRLESELLGSVSGLNGESTVDSAATSRLGGFLIPIVATLLVVALGVTGYLISGAGEPSLTGPPINSLSSEEARPNHDEFALRDSHTVVARVVWTTMDTTWSKDAQPTDFLLRLRPGNIIGIESGFAKIEFSDGALVLLHSPSLLQVTSATSARLIRGQVAGRAENGNFTLSTPSATVVDIGTEFGVGVNAKGTDVTVFEGEVHVHGVLSSTTAGPLRRLTQGMSLNIDSNGTTSEESASHDYHRELFQPPSLSKDSDTISLLDFIGGQSEPQHVVAGSIDPQTGYWGRLPWVDPGASRKLRGDTQFTPTGWNAFVDGVFIPRSNAREMQIDSDGHMVYLPPNAGSTWGPVWARRRSDLDESHLLSCNRNDAWGHGKLAHVLERLSHSRSGIMGLHANVGITFDLDAIRSATGNGVDGLEAGVSNLAGPMSGGSDSAQTDLRIFVDGKLRYSRIAFRPSDGEESLNVAIDDGDRFVTIAVTDAEGDSSLDHAVLIDPVFHLRLEANPPATHPQAATSSD